MLKTRAKLKTERGDTIVEVLIVLAVLGLAISIAYATANKSLLNTRLAEENSQATELVQSQIERLITLSPTGTTPNIYQSGAYCLDSSNTVYLLSDYANYPSACTQDGQYQITIDPPSTSAGGVFTVSAQWPDILGEGTDSVTLSYDLYP